MCWLRFVERYTTEIPGVQTFVLDLLTRDSGKVKDLCKKLLPTLITLTPFKGTSPHLWKADPFMCMDEWEQALKNRLAITPR